MPHSFSTAFIRWFHCLRYLQSQEQFSPIALLPLAANQIYPVFKDHPPLPLWQEKESSRWLKNRGFVYSSLIKFRLIGDEDHKTYLPADRDLSLRLIMLRFIHCNLPGSAHPVPEFPHPFSWFHNLIFLFWNTFLSAVIKDPHRQGAAQQPTPRDLPVAHIASSCCCSHRSWRARAEKHHPYVLYPSLRVTLSCIVKGWWDKLLKKGL